jgi:hypothetical protein
MLVSGVSGGGGGGDEIKLIQYRKVTKLNAKILSPKLQNRGLHPLWIRILKPDRDPLRQNNPNPDPVTKSGTDSATPHSD